MPIFIHTISFLFLHSKSIFNHEPQTQLQSISPSESPIEHGSEVVEVPIVDKFGFVVDKVLNKILFSPYFGQQDVVNFFEPNPYYYLPPAKHSPY